MEGKKRKLEEDVETKESKKPKKLGKCDGCNKECKINEIKKCFGEKCDNCLCENCRRRCHICKLDVCIINGRHDFYPEDCEGCKYEFWCNKCLPDDQKCRICDEYACGRCIYYCGVCDTPICGECTMSTHGCKKNKNKPNYFMLGNKKIPI